MCQKTTSVTYITSASNFWNRIPRTQELTCGQVRFTGDKIEGGKRFALKAEALRAMEQGDVLVREVQVSSGRWHYQLLKG